ncbi:citrate synthase [Ceratobasidium sp. 392]|nr:citrate synthase [Ceratobasidium sp. 392]
MLVLDVEVSEGGWSLEGQILRWWYELPNEGEKEVRLKIRRKGGPIKGVMRGFGGVNMTVNPNGGGGTAEMATTDSTPGTPLASAPTLPRVVPGAPPPVPPSKGQKKKRKSQLKNLAASAHEAALTDHAPDAGDIKAGKVDPVLLANPAPGSSAPDTGDNTEAENESKKTQRFNEYKSVEKLNEDQMAAIAGLPVLEGSIKELESIKKTVEALEAGANRIRAHERAELLKEHERNVFEAARHAEAALLPRITSLLSFLALRNLLTHATPTEISISEPERNAILSAAAREAGRVLIVRTVALIAEGASERHAREILHAAQERGVPIIGPTTVGSIKPGCFRIGSSGGMMGNIIASKLYRTGSVDYVSKSGGMSNELNNNLSLVTNGTYEGIAIGGDRYPGTSFIDHLRYKADPECKMLVLLGEVSGVEKYRVIETVKSSKITKPVVAWAIGTCAKMFVTQVQFGHAGSMADSQAETADAKNAAMKAAGFVRARYLRGLAARVTADVRESYEQGYYRPRTRTRTPCDSDGLRIRKPAAFISTISDERGQKLLYAHMKILDVFKEDIGLGGVVSLVWFKRRLPAWATKFIEMVLMLTADHGPAVSGAMNTIVASRAGKDLISSLASGLLTIGSRFGGALDEAASMFFNAPDTGLAPREFVDENCKANKLISGIGHKIKSVNNPDLRVELVEEYVNNFPSHSLLDYALAVEKDTTAKKDTECGTFEVPLDYHNPSTGTAQLAVIRLNATKTPRLGTLFVNRRGPGNGEVSWLLGDDLKLLITGSGGQYDLVGWDPRGTGIKLRFKCFDSLSDAHDSWNGSIRGSVLEVHNNFTNLTARSEFYSHVQELDDALVWFYDRCKSKTSHMLQYVGTVVTTRYGGAP